MAKRKKAKATAEATSSNLSNTPKTRAPTSPRANRGTMGTGDEAMPRRVLYPRDPSPDPQLVWKGKDKQDRRPLEVPAVPNTREPTICLV